MSPARRRSFAAARTLARRRVLLLLAALALLLNFLGSVRMHRLPHDRFDFSAALCLTSGTALAARPAPSVPAELPPEPAPGGAASCCPLCCGGDLPLAATIFAPSLPAASGVRRVAIPAGIPTRPAVWRQHRARAPPFSL